MRRSRKKEVPSEHRLQLYNYLLSCILFSGRKWSGRMDLNHRLPGPKPVDKIAWVAVLASLIDLATALTKIDKFGQVPFTP